MQDRFLPENESSTVVWFDAGKPYLSTHPEHDITIEMDISEFSAMVTGAVTFDKLHSYNLAHISDVSAIPTITQLFRTPQKPICLSRF